MEPRLKKKFNEEVVPAMMAEFKYKNPMQVPRLKKIIINAGVGEATQNPKSVDVVVSELSTITGQKPVITKAKKSIAAFKLREGMTVGVMVTLRKNRMFEFFDRFVNIALPRVRDFRGISPKSFDGRGNYSLGITEQLIFPEVDYDKVDKVRGMGISITTTARSDEEAYYLLKSLGMPFRK